MEQNCPDAAKNKADISSSAVKVLS